MIGTAVTLHPEWFAMGAEAADGSGWELFGEIYTSNPARLVGPDEAEIVMLWRFLNGGFSAGPLPEAGGLLDQSAWLMDAMAIVANAAEALNKGPADE
jgi:hypothetical protein